MIARAIAVHVALLVVSAGASLLVWTRDKKPAAAVGEVTIWTGRAADVQRISFASKGQKVVLEARSDAQGRWFLGTAESSAPPAADAGPAAAPRTATFVSIAQADKLAEALAPLRAVRNVGVIGADRAAEFGLKEPDGTLAVTIGGKERALTIGGRTPGGADRYVRDDASSTVYVVKSDVTRDLEAGQGTLGEHDPHAFKDADVESMRIVARGKARGLLRRGPESKRYWADPSAPDKADETAANWVAKVERLRPTEYLANEPAGAELVVRIEYEVKGASGAFLEIAKVPGAQPPATATPEAAATAGTTVKFDYAVRTERTRRWAKVFATVAEQVEQDLGSILR